MGSLESGTCSPLISLALQLLLLLDSGWGQEKNEVLIFKKQVTTNFAYRIQRNIFFPKKDNRNATAPWSLPPDALTLSTVMLYKGDMSLTYIPCIRIDIAVNSTGLPELQGFDVDGLEIGTNKYHSFRILKKKKPKHTTQINLWKVQHDCWFVSPGQYISVTLSTQPDYGVSVNTKYYIADKNAAPSFQYQHFAEEKRVEVFIPEGPPVYARLCHLANVCEDLNNSTKQLVSPDQNVSLSYEHILPCLCIEVFYTYRDSKRKKVCPFIERPEIYGAALLDVSVREDIVHLSNRMEVTYSSPCPMEPRVSLCMKHNGSCMTVPDAVITKDHTTYHLDSVDKDPHLCFKFSLLNNSHIKCPDERDRAWKVDVEMKFFQALLTISSDVSASFRAAICRPDPDTGHCLLQSINYNASTLRSKEVHLSLPRPNIGSCIKVWRSDVRFSHRYLFCSLDFSHKHLGLIALLVLIVVFVVVLLLFMSYRRIWKIFTAPLWRRSILLVYSPDSLDYKNLICAFADFLQSILGCEVILDMWDMNTVSQIGMLPWFYQKRDLVTQRNGKVIIVWTKHSKAMYEQWRTRTLKSSAWKDSTNLFGAAMSCLQKDFEVEPENRILETYTIVYFEGLCKKKDIPKRLRKISRYRLFKQLYRLVSKLQDTTCVSPPCLIKAVAKYFMNKTISSERSRGLHQYLEVCKQKAHEELA